MADLKTLKEIGFNTPHWSLVNKGDLRQEAIKWIRSRMMKCKNCVPDREPCEEHRFWLNRFNLSEEDIKEKRIDNNE